jgi:hypothetical protein
MKKFTKWMVLGVFAAVVATGANGQSSEKETSLLNVTEPVDVGGTILQPGTYRIKVVPLSTNRNLLRVTSDDESKLFVSVIAVPHAVTANQSFPDNRFVYFPPTTAGAPLALRTWFAADLVNGGHDIVYPKRRALELAAAVKEPVVAFADETKEADYKTVPLATVTPEPKAEMAIAEKAPEKLPEPPPAMVAENRPVTELPRTASHTPLFALLGVVSLAGALSLRLFANRAA